MPKRYWLILPADSDNEWASEWPSCAIIELDEQKRLLEWLRWRIEWATSLPAEGGPVERPSQVRWTDNTPDWFNSSFEIEAYDFGADLTNHQPVIVEEFPVDLLLSPDDGGGYEINEELRLSVEGCHFWVDPSDGEFSWAGYMRKSDDRVTTDGVFDLSQLPVYPGKLVSSSIL